MRRPTAKEIERAAHLVDSGAGREAVQASITMLKAYQYGAEIGNPEEKPTSFHYLPHGFDLTNREVELLLQGLKEARYDV